MIDLQEPFLGVIWERERLLKSAKLLVEAANVLSIPVIATTQYRQKLGGCTQEIEERFTPNTAVLDKTCFSCMQSEEFRRLLVDTGREQIVLCGLETHICVLQTALDLLHQGYQVHCVADAVSSRTVEKHKLGMEKIRDAGVIPCSAEGAVFELLREAGTPQFKAIHPLLK